MAYLDDNDLTFLAHCSDDELSVLVETLITDKDGEVRYTEALTSTDEYKEFQPEHSKYWQNIAAEIQCYGANTLASMFRGGKGILYLEVLTDVCKKMKVNHPDKASVETMERNLLMKFFEDAVEKLSTDDLKELIGELELKTTDFTSKAVVSAIQLAIKTNGILAYKLALIVANGLARALLGHGLAFTTNIAIVRSISVFAGPIGWAITGVWTLTDIAGPAYRVTIPAVVQIACLRAKSLADSQAE